MIFVNCCFSNARGVLPDTDTQPHGSLTSHGNYGTEFKGCYAAKSVCVVGVRY